MSLTKEWAFLLILLVCFFFSADAFRMRLRQSSGELSRESVSKDVIRNIPLPHEPIDIVYTWVNGSDSQWLKVHNEWLQKLQKQHPDRELDESSKLFSDNGELRYSIRSLFRYGKGINFRKVFIVTYGHYPSWLNVSHPDVEIVPHDKIFKSKDQLPSFSTFAIEANLHRIPGLSDFYIYFNDDFFMGTDADRSAFIDDSNRQIIYMGGYTVKKDDCIPARPWKCACSFSNELLNKKFGERKRNYGGHAPLLMSKKIMQSIEKQWEKEFNQTSSSKFRAVGHDSISLAFFYENYLIDNGAYSLRIRRGVSPYSSYNKSFKMVDVVYDPQGGRGKDRDPKILAHMLDRVKDNLFFNINKAADCNPLISDFLSKRFSEPSPLELGYSSKSR